MLRHFGEKVRYLRRRHQVTQVELAHTLAFTSHVQVSYLERSLRGPSLQTVLILAHKFGVTIDYLVNDDLSIQSPPLAFPQWEGSASQTPKFFGTKLTYLRKAKGLTQVDLARILEPLTQAQVSHLERGASEPSLSVVLRVVNQFQVSADYLLRDELPVDERSVQ